MKELYISPDVEIVNFLAMQAIANNPDVDDTSREGDWGEDLGNNDDIN